jgi:hypothetical protein
MTLSNNKSTMIISPFAWCLATKPDHAVFGMTGNGAGSPARQQAWDIASSAGVQDAGSCAKLIWRSESCCW